MYHNNYCLIFSVMCCVFYCVLDFQVGLMYHNKYCFILFINFCCIHISPVNAQAGRYDMNFTLLVSACVRAHALESA